MRARLGRAPRPPLWTNQTGLDAVGLCGRLFVRHRTRIALATARCLFVHTLATRVGILATPRLLLAAGHRRVFATARHITASVLGWIQS